MKITRILLTFVLSTALLLTGCGEKEPDPSEKVPNDTTDSQNVYSSLITLLESELKQLREEQGKYQDRIEELEKELEKVKETTSDTTTATPPPDTNEEPSPFTYKITDGKAEISAYNGNYSVLVIPEKLDGYEVVSIGDSVFSGNSKLTSVSLPQGLVRVGWFAFSGCTSLQSVTLPQSVENIGYDAFAYCTKLTIYCKSGSYAEKYAQSYGIRCVAN